MTPEESLRIVSNENLRLRRMLRDAGEIIGGRLVTCSVELPERDRAGKVSILCADDDSVESVARKIATSLKAMGFGFGAVQTSSEEAAHARRVVIESPYAGDTDANIEYARDCLRDCLLRGESPYASHLLHTQPGVLNDDIPEERDLGIRAGFCWRTVAHATVVYTDLGISRGMALGIADAERRGGTVEYRQLDEWADARAAVAQEGVA